ncbi:MAG TPA: hypothetical protein VHL85_03605 [Burkholderiales bacterium]|jgi:hypothetical protein|nr:hypothetical protein [Burkholderiales bacterium]
MSRIFYLLLAMALAACASVARLQSGEQELGGRLVLDFDGAWNEVGEQLWTREGLPIDQLRVFAGIRDGEPLEPKGPVFHAGLPPAELPALFAALLGGDGSAFTLRKVEPCGFAGGGTRFEYVLRRKLDNVELAGVGYASVRGGALFAMLYSAPRLVFFDRYRPAVERIAQSARIKA